MLSLFYHLMVHRAATTHLSWGPNGWTAYIMNSRNVANGYGYVHGHWVCWLEHWHAR